MEKIMRISIMCIITLLPIIFMSTPLVADGTLSCGLKPLPDIGCRIGRCVDGHWEQVCD